MPTKCVADGRLTCYDSIPHTFEVPKSNLAERELSEHNDIPGAIEAGNSRASEQLFSQVYAELRKLAAAKLAHEPAGQTLQPTALVHEAYLRLAGSGQPWDSQGHFFAAAALAMRRILVDAARQKKRLKRGGEMVRQELELGEIAAEDLREDVLALDEALDGLGTVDPQAATLVHLRYFAGMTLPQAAQLMDISPRTADRLWAYARAWLHQRLQQ
jgi:RNA polymerase sigma factor (TIGR02999 family)